MPESKSDIANVEPLINKRRYAFSTRLYYSNNSDLHTDDSKNSMLKFLSYLRFSQYFVVFSFVFCYLIAFFDLGTILPENIIKHVVEISSEIGEFYRNVMLKGGSELHFSNTILITVMVFFPSVILGFIVAFLEMRFLVKFNFELFLERENNIDSILVSTFLAALLILYFSWEVYFYTHSTERIFGLSRVYNILYGPIGYSKYAIISWAYIQITSPLIVIAYACFLRIRSRAGSHFVN